jgi:hypothetical protein
MPSRISAPSNPSHPVAHHLETAPIRSAGGQPASLCRVTSHSNLCQAVAPSYPAGETLSRFPISNLSVTL